MIELCFLCFLQKLPERENKIRRLSNDKSEDSSGVEHAFHSIKKYKVNKFSISSFQLLSYVSFI